MTQEEFDIKEKLEKILGQLIERGMELPFLAAALANNESFMIAKFSEAEGGLKAKIIESHFKDGMVVLPINMMFVDAQGRAVRLVIGKPDEIEISDLIGHA